MRKTKVICTIGPACEDAAILKDMCLAGMNVARLNFSHGTHEEHQQKIDLIKSVREELNYPIALMLDTKGPEYRIGTFENKKITLKDDDTFTFTTRQLVGNESIVSVNYDKLMENLEVGDKILVNNGLVIFEVTELNDTDAKCRVVIGGELSNRKSMNFPGKVMKHDFLSEQDKKDLLFGIKNDVDFVAASFVSNKQDVADMREFLDANGGKDIEIIAKIENRSGVNNIEEICQIANGVMVARGDLGVEAKMEDLPILQKMIIKKCREQGKIAVVATEMLESMKKSVRPTRAEVSDVANAVLDGTDAVMLSGETTTGKYPVETVGFMASICENTEGHTDFKETFDYKKKVGLTQTISTCVVESAEMLNSKLIVAATISGFTARKISNLRPNCLVLACCPNEDVCRSLSLNYGVYTTFVPVLKTTDEVIAESLEKAKEFMNLNKDDTVIITGGFPNTGVKKTTNLMKIEII